MRTYGRIKNKDGTLSWVEVDTDSAGNNDAVLITTLCQCLLLNLGESPRFANYGIPARQSVLQQLFPDYYVARTQQQFSQYFASLIITKRPSTTPTYDVAVITHSGAKLTAVATQPRPVVPV